MSEEADDKPCEAGQLAARRITLKDGRYMIFFEFGDKTSPEASEQETSQEEAENV